VLNILIIDKKANANLLKKGGNKVYVLNKWLDK
jgi:hypothetical protein